MRKTLLSPMLVYLILFNTGAALAVEARNKNDLNMEALSLLQQGKITESISVWERIPQGDRTAEVLNNLGVAYYKRSRQYFDGKYGKESYFNEDFQKARNFLDSSQKIAPKRWNIYLNLGDIYFHYGLLEEAKKNYKLLLSLKPKYKYAEKVNAKIRLIERESMLSRNNNFKSFIVEVHPSLPLYVFRIHRNPERVDVLKGEKPSIVQSISVNGEIDSSDTLLVADLNLDGYFDILILSFDGSGHNYGYNYWVFDEIVSLYNTVINLYEYDNTELVGPFVDYISKTVIISWSGSDHNSITTFEFKNGKRIEKEFVYTKYIRNKDTYETQYHEIIKRNINGKMIVVSDKVHSE